jgi:opacity protein-like surface antigen
MKLMLSLVALGACATAMPAAAQPWYDPATLLHNGYVEVEGGAAFQGRTKINIAATGLGQSSQSAAQDTKAFGGALAGYKLVEGVAVEAEGFYSRNNLAYTPNNAVFGAGGATRTYGGLANLRLSLPFTPTYNLALAGHTIPIGVTPYIAPGIGYGRIQFTGTNGIYGYDDRQSGFIWQAKAGLEVRTGQHIAFDIAYRYLQSPDYTHPGFYNSPGYSALTRSHIQAATLGLKYYF